MQNSGPQITLLTGKLVIFKITIKHIHRDRDLGAFSSDDLRPNFRRSRHRIIPSVSKGAILGKFDPVIFGRAPPTRPARAIFSDMMTFVIDETHGVKVRSSYSQLNSRIRHAEVGWRLDTGNLAQIGALSGSQPGGRSTNLEASTLTGSIDTLEGTTHAWASSPSCAIALRGPTPASPTTYSCVT